MGSFTENRQVRIAPDYAIAPIIVGGWQLSRGHGGGLTAGENPRRFLSELVARGFTTFDCADIYTGVEELLGDFLRHHGASGSGLGREDDAAVAKVYARNANLTLPGGN